MEVYGTCALLSLDESEKKLHVIVDLDMKFKSLQLNFDSTCTAPRMKNPKKSNPKGYSFMNKYSFWLLQNLKWPDEIIMFFKTTLEAIKILKILFPDPELVEAENLEIRAKVTPFDDIDWTFQSSLESFRSFPAKPLKVAKSMQVFFLLKTLTVR